MADGLLSAPPAEIFDAFYRELHVEDDAKRKHGPYLWQLRLATELAELTDPTKLPSTLEAPTGAGKTTLVEAYLFALARQLAGGTRTLPLRLFWVVDRRSVVDQVFHHANAVAERIAVPSDGTPTVRMVGEALGSLAASPHSPKSDPVGPVQCQRWRGGTGLRPTTLRPDIPAIVCSTIDQVGSRLLFRGYGVGPGNRPTDAALVGTDSLVVVDEAHIAQPFVDTATTVASIQESAPAHPGRPLRTMLVSATLADRSAGHAAAKGFRLTADELAEPPLARRLNAKKIVHVGKKFRSRVTGLVTTATKLATEGGLIGVIANTVDEARRVHTELSKDHRAWLLIGPSRPLDRDALVRAIPDRSQRQDGSKPHIIVATQTIEVGMDLDFDALTTSCAPLDALAQRLGRLDRAGTVGTTAAVVVHSSEECPVYGKTTVDTWDLLTRRVKGDDTIPLGPRDVNELIATLSEDERAAVMTTRRSAPLLGPWDVEALSHTSLTPDTPVIEPFLHGDDATARADVQLVWREDLRIPGPNPGDPRLTTEQEHNWIERLKARPPHPGEAVSLPPGVVRRWLTGTGGSTPMSDIESLGEDGQPANADAVPFAIVAPNTRATALEVEVSRAPGLIRPGATIVVPQSYGCCDEFGWIPQAEIGRNSKRPTDLGGCGVGARVLLDMAWGNPARRTEEHSLAELLATVAYALERFPDDLSKPDMYCTLREPALVWLRSELESYNTSRAARGVLGQDPLSNAIASLEAATKGTVTVVDGKSIGAQDGGSPAVVLKPASGRSSRRPHPVELCEHAEAVEYYACRFAEAAFDDSRFVRTVEVAARYHDHGKRDPRFQRWLYLGEMADPNKPLAKSGVRPSSKRSRRHRIASGWPESKRHELLSAALVAHSTVATDETIDIDVALHIIATHHGHHRPYIDTGALDPDPPRFVVEVEGAPVEIRADGSLDWPTHASRFGRLNQAHSPWGLAQLEASLVLADWLASDEEQL